MKDIDVNSSSKLNAIKELIFGEEIASYKKEFEDIKAELNQKKEELIELIDAIRGELIQNIDNSNSDLNIRLTQLEAKLNEQKEEVQDKAVDKVSLSELLIDLGNKLAQ